MNKLVVLAVGSVVVAIGSAVASAVTAIRCNSTIKKLNNSIDKVEVLSEDQISDKIISTAVGKAANKRVGEYLQDVHDDAMEEGRIALVNGVRNAVSHEAELIREKVTPEIMTQVQSLDTEDLKKRICDQAEKHMMDKLDGCLDAANRQFKAHLEKTQRTYDALYASRLKRDISYDDNVVKLIFSND